MGRRRKSDDGAVIIFVLLAIAFFAALIALAVVAPAALFGWWLITEAKRVNQPGTQPTFSVAEQKQKEALTDLLLELNESKQHIVKIGEQSRTPRRSDDLFDARFGNGRELNRQLESIDQQISSASMDKFALDIAVSNRISNWRTAQSRNIGARMGMAVYVIALFAIGATQAPWAAAIGRMTNVLSISLTPSGNLLFGASAVASIIAGLTLGLMSLLYEETQYSLTS